MIKLVAFVLGCVAGYTLNEKIEALTGKDDSTIKQLWPAENVSGKVKLQEKRL